MRGKYKSEIVNEVGQDFPIKMAPNPCRARVIWEELDVKKILRYCLFGVDISHGMIRCISVTFSHLETCPVVKNLVKIIYIYSNLQ